jgi:hypothetical protein
MKKNANRQRLVTGALIIMGFLSTALNSHAQRSSVLCDPQLGNISLADEAGIALNAGDLETDKMIKIQLPVMNFNHGEGLPAGSCKIKIGLGSKLTLDPTFDLNTAALNGYFKWTSNVQDGQVQITGDLINELPAGVTTVPVAFKVKAALAGRSTITANFLITNHNSATILSDENGSNNAASLAYSVAKAGNVVVPSGEATQPYMYPNPVAEVKQVVIETKQGAFKGTYTISISDAAGQQMQATVIKLDGVQRFNYKIGNIAAGVYIMKLAKAGTSLIYTLKFEKL